jgi:hypothetical protein
MNCNCPENYTLVGNECVKTTTINDIECPSGCETIIRIDGTVYCKCTDSVDPTIKPLKKPIYFDNTDYFKDVSWTIAYKPTEGAWNSYFTFYPDFSISSQEYFQVGYNWGEDKGSLWSHPMNNNSFSIFQGKNHGFMIEFPVANDNSNKILNSLSIDVQAKRFLNHYDDVVQPNVGVTDLMIYNSKNNSGNLKLHPQKSITDERKYPITEGNNQHILTTFTEGKQITNYFFNRVLNENSNIPMFQRDANNIFKTIDPRAVRFGGKRMTERLKGDNFIVNLSNTQNSQYQILIKSLSSNETTV